MAIVCYLLEASVLALIWTLMCTDPPLSDVHHVKFSLTGNHVTLWGPGGVSIMEVPRRWGKHAEFEERPRSTAQVLSSSREIVCYPEFLAAAAGRLASRQPIRHPPHQSSSHLTMCSDSTNTEKTNSPHQSFQLGESADSFSLRNSLYQQCHLQSSTGS
ncbi:nucleoporin 88-like [Branchiostoma floridae x Branchiostoma japonicum]